MYQPLFMLLLFALCCASPAPLDQPYASNARESSSLIQRDGEKPPDVRTGKFFKYVNFKDNDDDNNYHEKYEKAFLTSQDMIKHLAKNFFPYDFSEKIFTQWFPEGEDVD